MPMSYENRWEIVKELGEGGQGKVFLVRDTQLYTNRPFLESLADAIRELDPGVRRLDKPEMREGAFAKFRQCILDIVKSESPSHQGALKVLHKPALARDHERASERIRREILAMSETAHPNLLRILDSDVEEGWFVSQFHSNGVLGDKLDAFKGNFPAALAAFRPLVAAVA